MLCKRPQWCGARLWQHGHFDAPLAKDEAVFVLARQGRTSFALPSESAEAPGVRVGALCIVRYAGRLRGSGRKCAYSRIRCPLAGANDNHNVY